MLRLVKIYSYFPPVARHSDRLEKGVYKLVFYQLGENLLNKTRTVWRITP